MESTGDTAMTGPSAPWTTALRRRIWWCRATLIDGDLGELSLLASCPPVIFGELSWLTVVLYWFHARFRLREGWSGFCDADGPSDASAQNFFFRNVQE